VKAIEVRALLTDLQTDIIRMYYHMAFAGDNNNDNKKKKKKIYNVHIVKH